MGRNAEEQHSFSGSTGAVQETEPRAVGVCNEEGLRMVGEFPQRRYRSEFNKEIKKVHMNSV